MAEGRAATEPGDATARRKVAPVICYPAQHLPEPDLAAYHAARGRWRKLTEIMIPPREARCFDVPADCFFRIVSIDGPQVGDLNLWSAQNLEARFSPVRRGRCTDLMFPPAIGSGPACPS